MIRNKSNPTLINRNWRSYSNWRSCLMNSYKRRKALFYRDFERSKKYLTQWSNIALCLVFFLAQVTPSTAPNSLIWYISSNTKATIKLSKTSFGSSNFAYQVSIALQRRKSRTLGSFLQKFSVLCIIGNRKSTNRISRSKSPNTSL